MVKLLFIIQYFVQPLIYNHLKVVRSHTVTNETMYLKKKCVQSTLEHFVSPYWADRQNLSCYFVETEIWSGLLVRGYNCQRRVFLPFLCRNKLDLPAGGKPVATQSLGLLWPRNVRIDRWRRRNKASCP